LFHFPNQISVLCRDFVSRVLQGGSLFAKKDRLLVMVGNRFEIRDFIP
jgi:hypothetical protein